LLRLTKNVATLAMRFARSLSPVNAVGSIDLIQLAIATGKRMTFSNMIRRGLVASAFLIELVWATQAQAGSLFDYSATVNAATSPTLPANPPGFGAAVIAIGNGNSLTFTTNTAAAIDGTLSGGADINFGNIIFNASGSNTVTPYAVNFNYEISITDQPSGDVGTVNFTGQVNGTARGTPRAINSTITNYAVAPQQLILGGSSYLISVTSVIGPGSFFDGVLQGNIQIVPVPEPSSIVLGLAVFAGVALAAVRKKTRRA
jgi:hypothetical protein